MKKMLLCLTALLLLAAPAMAQSYYKLSVGYFSPENSALDSTYNIQGAYGKSGLFGQPVSVELGLGFAKPDAPRGDVVIVPVTLTALYEIPAEVRGFTFNVGGGIGYYFWNGRDGVWDTGSGSDFGFHLQGGTEYKLSETFGLIGEVRWASADDTHRGFKVDLGGTTVNVGFVSRF
jgi:opacity protein-like surface antigen